MNKDQAAPPPWLSWSIWAVAATFYLAAFYLRSSPAVMTTELMRDFGIGASQLGAFSAVYFYAYIAMQIPTGVLVDSWGARRLLIGGSLVAAVGACLFAATSSYGLASTGRLIVGGAQENTLLSCEGQHDRGHDVTLITGPPIGPEGSLLERAIHWLLVRSALSRSRLVMRGVATFLRIEGKDRGPHPLSRLRT